MPNKTTKKATTEISEELDHLEGLQSAEFRALQGTLFVIHGLYVQVRNMYKEAKSENKDLKETIAAQQMLIEKLQREVNTVVVSEVEVKETKVTKTKTKTMSFSPERPKRVQFFQDEDVGSDDGKKPKRNRVNSLSSN